MSHLFSAGEIYASIGIQALMAQGYDFTPFLERHLSGDWGDVDEDDALTNHYAATHSGRMLLSLYDLTSDIFICILTDLGRTTIMLPSEY
ncbi:hypothetical protein BH012_10000 [Salmonella enterica]|nr:hypothetical protein [Salmonella enterica]EAX6601654.1 hypothetical protein [Salmonella enterica]